MRENIFATSMTDKERSDIQKIKEHKAFMNRIIADLNEVYHARIRREDKPTTSSTWVDARDVRVGYEDFEYVADAKGIKAQYTGLGEYEDFGKLWEKYEKIWADDGFKGGRGFGKFCIKIPIGVEGYEEAISDIIFIMKKEKYNKRF